MNEFITGIIGNYSHFFSGRFLKCCLQPDELDDYR